MSSLHSSILADNAKSRVHGRVSRFRGGHAVVGADDRSIVVRPLQIKMTLLADCNLAMDPDFRHSLREVLLPFEPCLLTC
jgi:hypothetical protein